MSERGCSNVFSVSERGCSSVCSVSVKVVSKCVHADARTAHTLRDPVLSSHYIPQESLNGYMSHQRVVLSSHSHPVSRVFAWQVVTGNSTAVQCTKFQCALKWQQHCSAAYQI